MKIKILYFSLLLFLVSCGTTKTPSTAEPHSSKEVIAAHKLAMPQFHTLAGRMQVAYETEDKAQRITVSMRMEKDRFIWVKASVLGITIAKVLITPEQVSYYETIGKTYFEGDFAILGEWVGTPINFEQAQSLLLGQTIFPLEPGRYASEIFQNKFKLQPKRQPHNFIHSLFLYPEIFRVASETVSQPEQERFLNIRYGEYQLQEGQYFPTSISIISSESQEQTKIEITYKKIDLNVDVSFPFEIPDGYQQIKL